MKKTVLVLFIMTLGFCKTLVAQTPVTDSTWFPIAGEKYYKYDLAFCPKAHPNDTGLNVTWDYSDSFNPHYLMDSFDFALPAERNISCLNGASNLADGNSIFHRCYLKNDAAIYETGENAFSNTFGKDTIPTIYSKPQLVFRSALHYSDTFQDTSIYSFRFTSQHIDSFTRSKMITRWHYDGFGTLKIGTRTIENVVRIFKYITQEDSVYTNGSYFKSLGKIYQYEWYKNLNHMPILTLYGVTSSNYNMQYYGYFIEKISGAANIRDKRLNNTLKAYYKSGQIVINYELEPDNFFSLYDENGRILFNGYPTKEGENTWIIQSGKLSPGIYILHGGNTVLKLAVTGND